MATCGVALLVLSLQVLVSSGQSQGATSCDGNLASPTCSESIRCGQSSIYSISSSASSIDWRVGTSADCQAAIDGNTNTRWASVNGTGPSNCFSTAVQRHPYWWVDLGRTVNIHNITIYTEYNGRLDNAIVNLDGELIFTFTPPSGRQNPYYITSPLPRAGRNISVLYPESITYNVLVVLCEVQVRGCRVNKYGGPSCEHDCSVHCNDNGGETTCDSIFANCTNGCKAGWWGATCDQPCPTMCSPGRCDRNNGCLQCDGEFAAPLCTVCQSGWWGSQCDRPCPSQCSPGQCHVDRGCTQCINHYAAPNCTDCQAGWWGSDCDQACPAQCSTPGRCDRNGCAQCNNHYAAPLCTDCQSGWWGSQCDRQCPQRCSSAGCDKNKGCTQCNNHYVTPNCTVCDAGRYGQDCEERCSNGCNLPCNTIDGTCTCLTGWSGDRCQECTVGLWGASNCSLNCSVHCAGNGACHIEDGICTPGCMDGWNGPECARKPPATAPVPNCNGSAVPLDLSAAPGVAPDGGRDSRISLDSYRPPQAGQPPASRGRNRQFRRCGCCWWYRWRPPSRRHCRCCCRHGLQISAVACQFTKRRHHGHKYANRASAGSTRRSC